MYVFDWIHRYDDDRELLGNGAALIPSAKKRCGLGGELDVPLGHEDAAYVRSRFDAVDVRVPDAPAPSRSWSSSSSPTAAVPCHVSGGTAEIKGGDGLR